MAEEGTASSFRGLAEVVAQQGLFCALYARPRRPLFPHACGRRPGRPAAPDPGRSGALAQLGIGHRGLSPQARGGARSGPSARLEDRLPKELALAGISEIDAANVWLREHYLPAHNGHFAVTAEQPGTAFVRVDGRAMARGLCLQETRQVGNDNSVRWKGRSLQIPKSPLRPHFARASVRLHEYPDGAVALFWGPHRIADSRRPRRKPMTSRHDPLRRRIGCRRRCRVARIGPTEADN